MSGKSKAENDVLVAADKWARDAMRGDKALDASDKQLMNAIQRYQLEIKSSNERPLPSFPGPPHLPANILEEYEKQGIEKVEENEDDYFEHQTMRYSEVPTVPSPPRGMPAISIENWRDFIDDEDE